MEFSFQRVKTTIKDAAAQKIGFPKSLTTFLKKRNSKTSDFPHLRGNERYRTCDDTSTEIASIGIVSATIPIRTLKACECHSGGRLAPPQYPAEKI